MIIRHAVFLLLAILFVLHGCSWDAPDRDDMIGTWTASDEAVLEINADSTFATTNVSAGRLLGPSERFRGKILNDTGRWRLSG